jgi:predicted NAD-dependent protein-ADP-ribosyltransferase YbiA (DUF1768 family)
METENQLVKDQLVFYSKSASLAPGKGVHERVSGLYKTLEEFPEWRRTLSNFHVKPFVWTGEDVLETPFPEGTIFNSIEHAFQASKFWVNARDDARVSFSLKHAALSFSMAPDNTVGNGDGRAAQRARKMVYLNAKQLAVWGEISGKVQTSAAKAKYAQHPDCLALLKATAPAELLHLVTARGKPSTLVRFHHLEFIRDE